MPPGELINWLGQGSSVVLAVMLVGFLRGDLLARKAHEEQMAVLRQQLAEAQEDKAELWDILKGITGLTMETASLAKRSTRIAETQVTQASWAATEAAVKRPRQPRLPKVPPP